MEKKPVCKYGASCYRNNPEHLKQYSHPGRKEGVRTEDEKRKRVKRTDSSITSYFAAKPKPLASFSGSTSEGKEGGGDSVVSDESGGPPAKRKRLDNPGGVVDETTDTIEEGGKSCEDADELLKESSGDRENIRRKFLMDMPEDFYQFWDFCKTLKPTNPQGALKDTLGLELTGPYDVLGGKLKGVPWDKCVLHGRHYYDPPELVTVLTQQASPENQTGYHIGYFRDDPRSKECLLVSNCSRESCELRIEGESMFSVIRAQVTKKLRDKSLPMECKKQLETLDSEISSKMTHCKGQSLKELTKQRSKLTLARCFHKMGLIVPYNKDTELGYRPLPLSDRDLWRLLNKIASCTGDEKKRDVAFEPLQEVITLVQFANDECDYGMGLELGLDLFCHGNTYFHTVVEQLLPLAYDLLQREEYSKICQQHLINRTEIPLNFRV